MLSVVVAAFPEQFTVRTNGTFGDNYLALNCCH